MVAGSFLCITSSNLKTWQIKRPVDFTCRDVVSCERAGELEGLTKSQNRFATEEDSIQTSYLSGYINNFLFFLLEV
jgi:hypothetical protein